MIKGPVAIAGSIPLLWRNIGINVPIIPATIITVIKEIDIATEVKNSPFQNQVKTNNTKAKISPFSVAKKVSFINRFPKEMLEITSVLGTQQITWEDVHDKWCIPLWKGFAKVIGIEIEIIPGETCCVKLKK